MCQKLVSLAFIQGRCTGSSMFLLPLTCVLSLSRPLWFMDDYLTMSLVHCCCCYRTVSHLLYFHIAARSNTSRRKSAKADPAETPSKIPLSAPSYPVESRLPKLLQKSKSQEDFQQSQLPTAFSWILPTPMTSLKHCNISVSLHLLR